MPGDKLFLYIAWIAILTAYKLCDGEADKADADEERSPLPGSHHLTSVLSGRTLEPAAQTRPGSLVFVYDQQSDLNSTDSKFE